MPSKVLNLNSSLAVFLLIVMAFLLCVVPVSGKTALGGSEFSLGHELEKSLSNPLTLLEKKLSCRSRVSGICDGPENNVSTNNTANATNTADVNAPNQTSPNTDLTFNPQYWNHEINFNGNRVFQRDDLIDPNFVDHKGRTNLERMQEGVAPIGPDGESINLHHLTQRHDGGIAEVTRTMHVDQSSTLHINPNTTQSGIDRQAFERWKRDYWKSRANDFDPAFED